MALGLRFKNDYGTTLLSDALRNPVLVQSGITVASGSEQIVTYVGNASSQPLCALRATTNAYPWQSQVGTAANGWTWIWRYRGGGSYWVFDYATSGPASGTLGLRIGGGANPLVFAHTHKPLRVTNVIVGETTPYLGEITTSPTTTGAPASLTGAAGRTYGLVHGRLALQLIQTRSTVAQGEYQLRSFGLRAVTLSNGFSFEYVTYSTGASTATPNYSLERRLGFYSYLLVDVTNY